MSAKADAEDIGLIIWSFVVFCLGSLAGVFFGVVTWSDDAEETRQEACEQFVQADYVEDIKACVRGDEIVHRFEEEG